MKIQSWTALAGSNRHLRFSERSWCDGELSVKSIVITDDDDAEHEFLIVKLYVDDNWNHYAIRSSDGVVMAEGHAGLEKDSWMMARKMLVARGYVARSYTR